MTYASRTQVSPEKSRAEIENLLKRYGADQFMFGWGAGRAVIGFRCNDRLIRFELPIPGPTEGRSEKSRAYDQETRRLWRALALVIKAKLEAVASGITTFEREFMAHIVMPDGKTVGDHAIPMISEAYATGRVPLLLPASSTE